MASKMEEMENINRGDRVIYEGTRSEYYGEVFYFQPNGTSCYLYRHKADVGHPSESILTARKGSVKRVDHALALVLEEREARMREEESESEDDVDVDTDTLMRRLSLLTLMENRIADTHAKIKHEKASIVSTLLSRDDVQSEVDDLL